MDSYTTLARQAKTDIYLLYVDTEWRVEDLPSADRDGWCEREREKVICQHDLMMKMMMMLVDDCFCQLRNVYKLNILNSIR